MVCPTCMGVADGTCIKGSLSVKAQDVAVVADGIRGPEGKAWGWDNGRHYCCFPVSLTVCGPLASKHPFSAACFFFNFSSSIPNALTVCALCALYFLLIFERIDFPIVSVA